MVRGEPDVAVYTDATVSQVLITQKIFLVTLLKMLGQPAVALIQINIADISLTMVILLGTLPGIIRRKIK